GFPVQWIGTVQLQSTQPIAALAKVTGYGVFSVAGMTQPTTNGTFYVPRFEAHSGSGAPWVGMIALHNAGTGVASFNLTFYNPSGTVAQTMSQQVAAGQALAVSPLTFPTFFTSPFFGSVAITSTGTTAVVAQKVYYANFQPSSLASYYAPTAPPSGTN